MIIANCPKGALQDVMQNSHMNTGIMNTLNNINNNYHNPTAITLFLFLFLLDVNLYKVKNLNFSHF